MPPLRAYTISTSVSGVLGPHEPPVVHWTLPEGPEGPEPERDPFGPLRDLLRLIPEGKSALDRDVSAKIPEHLRPTSGFANCYKRIRRDEPSPTITRNFTTPSSANCIHPTATRALSLREGARCQSFPDSYAFEGTVDQKRLQIGNAVPPLLAKALGESLIRALH
jgi:site-specific DNA-cytosine methylase